MSFQTSVQVQPAPAVAGDFADSNPRVSVAAGPGGLIAGSAGLVVGRFGWWSGAQLDPNGTPAVVNNFGAGAPTGFIHREQQALITDYLAEGSNVIPEGFPVTLMSAGAFWVINAGAAAAQVGMKAFVLLATGQVRFAAAGSAAAAAASATGSIAAATFSVTGSINDEVLTVTVVGSGTLYPGATISGSGVASGTKIVSQLSGTAGGVGTYNVSIPEQTVASTTISGTYGIFTAASGLTGTFILNGVLTGTGISVTTTIQAQISGTTGGLGTYAVDVNTVVSSTAISQSADVETKWVAYSAGLTGEIVKISSHLQG